MNDHKAFGRSIARVWSLLFFSLFGSHGRLFGQATLAVLDRCREGTVYYLGKGLYHWGLIITLLLQSVLLRMPIRDFCPALLLHALLSSSASSCVGKDLPARLRCIGYFGVLGLSCAECQASSCLSLRHVCLRWVARVVTVCWDVR